MGRNKTKSQGSKRKTALCVVLALAVIGTAGAYILYSNSIVSNTFALNQKRVELREISSAVAAVESEFATRQDMSTLVSLAQQSGMIPGKDGETLFADGNVAIAQQITRP